ncbi:MAG: S41 family peptidase [Acidobacteriota bacterium]|nr:S41 family peptidase [Acidobacteriota bacterium]MDH3784913.1 S41 family peptidase [Acidobacteriota bacterium]
MEFNRNALLLIVLLFWGCSVSRTASDSRSEDIQLLTSTLPQRHANLFHQLPAEEFSAEMNQLLSRVDSLTDAEMALELARILARIGDGHTQLNLGQAGTGFRLLPVVLGRFEDGLFILMAAPEHADLLGAKVLKFGDLPAEDALEQVARYISGDNEMSALHFGPSRLTMVEMLAALGAAPSDGPVSLDLMTPDGTRKVHQVAPMALSSYQEIAWKSIERKSTPSTAAAQENYSYRFLDSDRVLYIQYVQCKNQEGLPLKKFAAQLWKQLQAKKPQAVVVDIRSNGGGDQTLNRHLISPLKRYQETQEVQVFGLIGRGTFSAAIEFAIQMERSLNATFVGEPTRGKPNHYGESEDLELPYSGLSIGYSAKFYQLSDVQDERPWIPPDIPVGTSFEDYIAGRDPALDTVLKMARPTTLEDDRS